MEAGDVRMDVEALICRCCRNFGIICLETLSGGFSWGRYLFTDLRRKSKVMIPVGGWV
jgi:hypothetical protein